jgi:hypothetical protein
MFRNEVLIDALRFEAGLDLLVDDRGKPAAQALPPGGRNGGIWIFPGGRNGGV